MYSNSNSSSNKDKNQQQQLQLQLQMQMQMQLQQMQQHTPDNESVHNQLQIPVLSSGPVPSNNLTPTPSASTTSGTASSSLGSRTRIRHRSGTLPTSLHETITQGNSTSINNLNSVSNNTSTGSAVSPNLIPTHQQQADINTLNSINRLRSLSTLSNPTTIWGDDPVSSSIHPVQQVQSLISAVPVIDENYVQSISSLGNPNNTYLNINRPRSQTYAATPVNTLNPNTLNNLQFLQQQQQQQQQAQVKVQQQQHASQYHRNHLSSSIARGSSFSFSTSLPTIANYVPPILQDNISESSITLTSSHTNPLLGPTNTLLFIHIPKDPQITNSTNFYSILKKFGLILSIRTIVCNDTKDLVLIVEFHDLEASINCKSTLQNCELYPGMKCSIVFAKILSLPNQNQLQFSETNQSTTSISLPASASSASNPLDFLNMQIDSLKSHDIVVPNILTPNYSNGSSGSSNNGKMLLEPEVLHFKITTLNDKISSFKKIQNHVLSQFPNLLSDSQMKNANCLLANALQYSSVKASNLGPLPPQVPNKIFDNPSLRELRKQLDSNSLSTLQVEEVALSMNLELPELASDYLGNTIVQKLLDIVSPVVRDDIVTELIPYLSQMSAHKNGTWAAQKLINTVKTEREMELISKSLIPYSVHLFNDTYANYVIHGVLKFEYPYFNFIFESLICSFLDISFNRFGSRAARTCLETVESDHKINKKIQNEVVLLVIVAILTWCVELMSDVNGSLLITWFLETCQLVDNKHLLLSYVLTHEDEFTDYEIVIKIDDDTNASLLSSEQRDILIKSEKFIKLCTLKLGTLSILKLLNYRTNLNARDLILSKIFGADIFNNDLNFESKNQSSDDEFILKAILLDLKPNTKLTLSGSNHGANLVHKILSIPTLDPIIKMRIIHKIKLILTDIISEHGFSISNNSLRRLAEECGIRGFQSRSTRSSFSNTANSNNANNVSNANSGNNSNIGGSLANVNAWKSRSRSNSSNTNITGTGNGVITGENSPSLFAINKGVEYDTLLRQQLEELSLNSTQNVVSHSNGINVNGMNVNGMIINGMNVNNMGMNMATVSVGGMNVNNMNNMNSMSNMNGINGINGLNPMNMNNLNMKNMHNIMNLNTLNMQNAGNTYMDMTNSNTNANPKTNHNSSNN